MRAIRNIVHGLGGLGAIVVVFLGYRGVQVNAYLAAIYLVLIGLMLVDWLWQRSLKQRWKIAGSITILAVCVVFWFMTEQPPPDKWIKRSPFRLSNAVVHIISPGGQCPAWCQDAIDLDSEGILFPIEAGRGFVVMGFTDAPTLTFKDPKPGKVPLPKSPRPQSGNAPSISIDSITLPGGSKDTYKIRSVQEKYRFEVADKRTHVVKAGDRLFLVNLTGPIGEDPEGLHTIYTYGFSVAEQ
jgi:hypothetical protein